MTWPTNQPNVAALPAAVRGDLLRVARRRRLATASRIAPSSLIWTRPFSLTRSSARLARRDQVAGRSSFAIFPEIVPVVDARDERRERLRRDGHAPGLAVGVGHPREELGEEPVRDRLRVRRDATPTAASYQSASGRDEADELGVAQAEGPCATSSRAGARLRQLGHRGARPPRIHAASTTSVPRSGSGK